MDKTLLLLIVCGGFTFLSIILGLAYYYYNKEDSTSSGSSTSPVSRFSTSPSPRPNSNVTINGENFDPTGTVSSGWIWNRKPLRDYTTSTSSDASECRQRCLDRSSCTHFARAESDGMCYLNEPDCTGIDSEGNRAHIHGIKKDGSNEYSKPIFMDGFDDTSYWNIPAASRPAIKQMTITECAKKCTSNLKKVVLEDSIFILFIHITSLILSEF